MSFYSFSRVSKPVLIGSILLLHYILSLFLPLSLSKQSKTALVKAYSQRLGICLNVKNTVVFSSGSWNSGRKRSQFLIFWEFDKQSWRLFAIKKLGFTYFFLRYSKLLFLQLLSFDFLVFSLVGFACFCKKIQWLLLIELI